MKEKEIYYIGGLDSNQRGAVGTHTSGIISGFKSNGYKICGIFIDGKLPHEGCNHTILVTPTKFGNRTLRSLIDRYNLIRKAGDLGSEKLNYHRFDPFLSPFVVNKNTILEYNDDVVAQVRFAAKKGHWSPIGRLIRIAIYPKLFRASEKYCFRKAAAVVAVTEKLRQFILSEVPKAKAIFVENGSNAVYTQEMAEPLQSSNNTLRIGHVGTLTPWDGLIDFLEALKIFQSNNPTASFHFRIVGTGTLEKEIVEAVHRLQLQDSVTIEPPVCHKEALKILHSIDLVPLLKTIDAYGLSPMKYYEALSLGCFLVCSDIKHINAVQEDAGIVVPFPFKPEEIAFAIEVVHRRLSQVRLERTARSARANAENSWESRVRELLSKVEGESL